MLSIQKIPNIDLDNLLIISLDIEHGNPDRKPFQYEVGVSVFDTLDRHTFVPHTLPTEHQRQLHKLITTRNFIVSEQLSLQGLQYATKFKFGLSEAIKPQELEPILRSIISDRKFCLVFHSHTRDIQFLERLKINIHLEAEYVFDTDSATRELFPKWLYRPMRYRLQDLAKNLIVPEDFCKLAMNDDSIHT